MNTLIRRVATSFTGRAARCLQKAQQQLILSDKSPLGEFYRHGGNSQLCTALPMDSSDLVLDVGGYFGQWTQNIIVRYGCRSHVFEPVPFFVRECRTLFAANSLVRVHEKALGASTSTKTFHLSDVATSVFSQGNQSESFKAEVVGIVEYLQALVDDCDIAEKPGAIACMKLNIEGGEYEVLESVVDSNKISIFRSLLIQFHRQPTDYKKQYQSIVKNLAVTHDCIWNYPMVWERWDLK